MLQPSVLRERLRSRLWPIPALAALAALVLGAGLSVVRPHQGSVVPAIDRESALRILDVLAGSSLTVVALVLSLQVVALQLAASQYSPRLLRTYARDWVIQLSLAVLIGTFVFSLVTLALFGAGERPPSVSVIVALLLALGCVAALVGVVAHIVASLRIETSMAGLHEDAAAVIRATYRGALDEGGAQFLGQGRPIEAQQSGFVQSVDGERLARWARARGVLVRVDARAGDHVLQGQVVAVVRGRMDDGDAPDDAPAQAILIGHERTPDADPGFGLLQLTDVALRALSPGINDPNTALHALGHVTSLLLQVAREGGGTIRITADADGSERVLQRLPALDELLRHSCLPLVRSGSSNPDVLVAILRLVRELLPLAGTRCRPGIDGVARHVERAAARDLPDQDDRESVRLALAALRADPAG